MAGKTTGAKLKAAEQAKRRKSERNRGKSERAQVLAVAELAEQTAAWWEAECPHPMANRLHAFAIHARRVAPLFGRLNPANSRLPKTIFACSLIGAIKAKGVKGIYRLAADVLGADEDALKMLAKDHRELVDHFANVIKAGDVKRAWDLPPAEAARVINALPRNSAARLDVYIAMKDSTRRLAPMEFPLTMEALRLR